MKIVQHETNMPAHLSAERRHPTAILELRGRQNPTPDLHHAVADRQPEFLHIGIVVEVRPPHEVVDLTLTIRGRSEQEF